LPVVLTCFHVLNNSTGHNKHENLPEYVLYNANSRMHVTTDVTPQET